MRKLILTILLVGCGSTNNQEFPTEVGGYVGDQYNRTKTHLADRGFTVEKAGQKVVDAKIRAIKYFTERNITLEDVVIAVSINFETFKDDYTAARKRVEKYFYTRGIRTMRHGDQDSTAKISRNSSDIEDIEAEIEALYDLIDAVEDDVVVFGAALSSSIDALVGEVGASDTALAAEIAELVEALVSSSSASSDAIAALEAEIASRLSEVEGDVAFLFNNVKALNGVTKSAKGQLKKLEAQLKKLQKKQNKKPKKGKMK